VGPIEAVVSAWHQYFGFSGRASRAEFWWYCLVFLVVTDVLSAVAINVLSAVAIGTTGIVAIVGLICLPWVVPSLAVVVRRLHDTGRSAWWILLNFVPIVGALVLLYLYVLPSDAGANRFGPPPPVK